MSAALRIEDYVGELPTIDIGSILASAAEPLARIELGVQRQRGNLDRLYAEVQDLSPEEINAGADDLLAMERQHAEIVVPWIKITEGRIDAMLRQGSAHTAAEKSYMRQQERCANALASWLENLRDMRIRLKLLASEKMRTAGAADTEITEDTDLDSYFQSIATR